MITREKAIHDLNNALVLLNNAEYVEPEHLGAILKKVPVEVLSALLNIYGVKHTSGGPRVVLEEGAVRAVRSTGEAYARAAREAAKGLGYEPSRLTLQNCSKRAFQEAIDHLRDLSGEWLDREGRI